LDIFFDSEFRKLIPPLQPDELSELEKSLKSEGNRDPIVIWKENKLMLDGHHRYDICTNAGIPLKPALQLSFPDRNAAIVWIIRNQFGRRNLSAYSRSVLALKLEEILKPKAKENQVMHGNTAPGRTKTLPQNSAEVLTPIETREEIAKAAHVSRDTISKVKIIEDKATDEQKAKLISGNESINGIFREIKSLERIESIKATQERIAELTPPVGLYQVLVLDPAWTYGRSTDETHRARNPYPSMTIDEMKDREKLPIPAADDSIMWLWTTNAYLHEAFHLMETWGFTYKTTLTWVKDKIGLGDWLRGQTEHCLVGVKGGYRLIPGNTSTVLIADSAEHSVKPESFYNMVDRLCPGNKIDIFGRKKHAGWDIWGTDSDAVQKE